MDTSSIRVFLSHSSEDKQVAGYIAQKLMKNGIDVWYDEWCIGPGDSIRQKIDMGLTDCTHFMVLLTPRSLEKPWVNQEMDAGLVRKLDKPDQFKFIPIRHGLPPEKLPKLLSNMLSPSVETDEQIQQLIHDIHGVSKKPKIGSPPAVVQNSSSVNADYSPAALKVAEYFVINSDNASGREDHIYLDVLAKGIELSAEDTEDAVDELKGFLRVAASTAGVSITTDVALYSEFDRYWKPWNAEEDANRIASDILNDSDSFSHAREIASRYNWKPRRINPAIKYLFDKGIFYDRIIYESKEWWLSSFIVKPDYLRRYVKSIQ
jgi:hypothetical protein